MKVSVQIVTRNSLRYIGNCLESLEQQTLGDFSLIVIDNGSTDKTATFVRNHFPTVTVLENFKNLGFSRAHNQGIAFSQAEYVLVLNPDIVLTETFLEKLVAFADTQPAGGSFGGKLLRLRSEAVNTDDGDSLRDVLRTNMIDSAGLRITRGRKVFDRGSGQQDRGQYERSEEVFGISGACALYRRSALDEIKVNGEYFDVDFFAYKEDADVAWRLRLYGFTNWYVPSAVGYHHRAFAAAQRRGITAMRANRRRVPPALRAASLKNHQLMLLKNEQPLNVLLALPWLLARQTALWGYALLTEPFQWRMLGGLLRQLPSALRKRGVIRAHTKVKPRDLRKWFR